jgi:copper homeostasis protein
MIRPRGGDFLYSDEEFGIMRHDVVLCKELGCDGVVFGLLLRDGKVDVSRTAQLVSLAYPMEVTFHRAFDRCREPAEALEDLVKVGCQRLLTSGQQPTAPEGVDLIAALVQQSSGRISIMPGSGVRTANVGLIRDATGATEFHSSLRGTAVSHMEFRHPAFREEDAYLNASINPADVAALRAAIYEGTVK